MRTLRTVCPLALVSPAFAQVVRTVGPQPGAGVDFTSVQSAIDASSNGDVVLVRSGTYANGIGAWTIDAKSLTLCADVGAAPVFIDGGNGVIRNLAAGQQVTLRGFTAPKSFALALLSNAGSVWIEDCAIAPPQDVNYDPTGEGTAGPALAATGCAGIVLQRCKLRGGPPDNFVTPSIGALALASSNVYLLDCEVTGLKGYDKFGTNCQFLGGGSPGTNAATLRQGTRLYASGSQLRGGKGGSCNDLFGCVQRLGGIAVRLDATSSVERLDTLVVGGAEGCPTGSFPSPAFAGIAGSPMGSVTVLPGIARHVSVPSPQHAGGSATLSVKAASGELAFVGLSAHPMGMPFPQWLGPLVLAGPISVFFLGATDANGLATKTVALPIPALASGAVVSYFQGAVVTTQLELRMIAGSALVTLASGI